MRFHPTNRPNEWAYVDDKYAWLIAACSWYVKNTGHVQGRVKGKDQFLHRVIVELEGLDWLQVDHKNRNPLDNRFSNLRLTTDRQQRANTGKQKNNTSGYKGVSWSRNAKKWCAQTSVYRRHVHLGYFTNKHEAARAYNQAALKYFGEYACLNVIEE